MAQPCEGDPLAQAGCSIQRRASRHHPRGHRLLTRRACARLADFSPANPRRGQWTSLRWPVAALRASEVVISPQPCEGDSLAQAGSPGRSRLRRDDVVSRSVRFSVTTLSGQEAGPTGGAVLRRASRFRSLRCGVLTRRACARLGDFSAANPRRGQWTSAHWPVATLRASEVVILAQPCEGDALAQAGSPGRSRLRRDDVVSRSVRFSVTTRLADFSAANPRRGQWTSLR